MNRNYLDLISGWHRGQPRFTEIVDFLTRQAQTSADFIAHLPQDFDLDEAIGVQLDVVGEWVGRDRNVILPIPSLWFSWDDDQRGWDVGIWKGPFDSETGITRLDDETYRRLLKAKIFANHWDGSIEQLREGLALFFNDAILEGSLLAVEDKLDMSFVVGIAGHIPDILTLALLAHGYLPLKPEGVRVDYLVASIEGEALFGFDMDNAYVRGWDSGTWGVSAEGVINETIEIGPEIPTSFFFLGF